MKKILLSLFFIFNSVFSFSALTDNLGIKYMYECNKCHNILREPCKTHKKSTIKIFLLEDIEILLNEFKKNEPRALHNYHDKKMFF